MNDIIIFSSKRCKPCHEAEKIFEEMGVKYEKIDVDTKDGAYLADKKGIKFLPTIIINGKVIEGLPSNLKEVVKNEKMSNMWKHTDR